MKLLQRTTFNLAIFRFYRKIIIITLPFVDCRSKDVSIFQWKVFSLSVFVWRNNYMDRAATIVSIITQFVCETQLVIALSSNIFIFRIHKNWFSQDLINSMSINKEDDPPATENVNNILLDLNWCSDSVFFHVVNFFASFPPSISSIVKICRNWLYY